MNKINKEVVKKMSKAKESVNTIEPENIKDDFRVCVKLNEDLRSKVK